MAASAAGSSRPSCVAGAQEIEDLDHQGDVLDTADMRHDPGADAGHLARLNRAPERFGAVPGDHVLGHAHLDADGDVCVFRHRLGAGVNLGEVEIVEFRERKRGEPNICDVHEGVEAGARLRHDEPAEAGEVVGAGIARRDAGGGALVGDEFVRGNPDRGAVRIDVAVQVDEAGRHQLAASIDRTQRPCGRDIGFDRFDHAIANADVAPAAQRLARIEHLAAFDHEIELVVRPHGGECRSPCGSERDGSGAG